MYIAVFDAERVNENDSLRFLIIMGPVIHKRIKTK